MEFLITASQIPPATTLHALIKEERSLSGHLIKPEVSRNDYLDQHLFESKKHKIYQTAPEHVTFFTVFLYIVTTKIKIISH